VAQPSAKALFYDSETGYIREGETADRRPVLSADGSAKVRLDRDATAPVANPISKIAPRIYQDTPRGVQGRDF
jgi:hypothetical protein